MTRQLIRRIVLVSAAFGTATLGACANPTGPSESGVYGGSGTMTNANSGVYGGSGTRANASGVYGGSGTRTDTTGGTGGN